MSLPCWERFEAQDAAYRDSVLPRDVRARVSVEAGVSLGWDRWVGDEGAIVGLDHFGASAPAGTIFEKFGFTVDRVDRGRPRRAGRHRPRTAADPRAGPSAGAARRPPVARARRARRRPDVVDRSRPQLIAA